MKSTEEFKIVNTRLDYVEKNIEKTEATLIERMKGMNEFRAQLKDQAGTFITREQVETKLQLQEFKIETLQKLVYIGMGILIILEIVVRFIPAIVK